MKIFKMLSKKFSTLISHSRVNLTKFIEIPIDKRDNTNLRVDRFIANKYGLHWDSIQKFFRNNEIFVIRNEKEKIKNPNEKLVLNDKVYVSRRLIEKNNENKERNNLEFDEDLQNNLENIFKSMVVLESKEILILNKIVNLACQNGTNLKFSIDSMLRILNNKYPQKYNLKLVHRLDKNVSGLILLGNQIDTVRKLGEIIKESKADKKYISLVQNVPLYLKHLLKNNILAINNTEHFARSLQGYIKSNEECDQFVIEMNHRSNYVYDSNLEKNYSIIKKNANYNIPDDLNMIGKFQISHFIYYDKTKKEFNLFKLDLNDLNSYSLEKLNDLQKFLNAIMNSFDKDDAFCDCYSLVLYELVSGKKHQIRKHMSKCFFSPIFNDNDYAFDKNISVEGFKIFNNEAILKSTSRKENQFLEKYKINDISKSIFLQSVEISLPKMTLTNSKIKNNQIKIITENDEKFTIKLINLSNNFEKLFKGMKINYKEDIYKI